MQIEPLDGRLQIDDDMAKVYAEVVCQVAGKFKIPLDPFQPESTFRVNLSKSLSPPVLEPSHRLFPPITLHNLGPVASQLPASLSLSFQLPSHQQAAKESPRPFCVSMTIKEREQKGNEDGARVADRNGNGEAKVAQKRSVKR